MLLVLKEQEYCQWLVGIEMWRDKYYNIFLTVLYYSGSIVWLCRFKAIASRSFVLYLYDILCVIYVIQLMWNVPFIFLFAVCKHSY
jgi:hypothetical protein